MILGQKQDLVCDSAEGSPPQLWLLNNSHTMMNNENNVYTVLILKLFEQHVQ